MGARQQGLASPFSHQQLGSAPQPGLMPSHSFPPPPPPPPPPKQQQQQHYQLQQQGPPSSPLQQQRRQMAPPTSPDFPPISAAAAMPRGKRHSAPAYPKGVFWSLICCVKMALEEKKTQCVTTFSMHSTQGACGGNSVRHSLCHLGLRDHVTPAVESQSFISQAPRIRAQPRPAALCRRPRRHRRGSRHPPHPRQRRRCPHARTRWRRPAPVFAAGGLQRRRCRRWHVLHPPAALQVTP